LNCFEITSNDGRCDIHPIGMEGLEPAQAPPGFKNSFVLQKGDEKVLVITCQGNHWSWPFAARKLVDHFFGATTTIDVVAQENRHEVVERPSLQIGLDTLGHLSK